MRSDDISGGAYRTTAMVGVTAICDLVCGWIQELARDAGDAGVTDP
jgi:hypothetical protein